MRNSLLLLVFLLSSFGQNIYAAAQDSVYAVMTLGSSGFKTEFSLDMKYARPQKVQLQRLKSLELAERAVRTTFRYRESSPPESEIKADAKKCAAALRVNKISGDTAWLAMGDPGIPELNRTSYLLNLMRALGEDNMNYAVELNRKTIDSLDPILDKKFLRLHDVEDTLFSFGADPEFTKESRSLLKALGDTVAIMKQKLRELNTDSARIARIFVEVDTFLVQLDSAYNDTNSRYYIPLLADWNTMAFRTEVMLNKTSVSLNAMHSILVTTPHDSVFLERQKSLMLEIIENSLSREMLAHYVYDSPSQNISVKGKKVQPVLKRYRKCLNEYQRCLQFKTQCLIARSSISTRSKIICLPAETPCKIPG